MHFFFLMLGVTFAVLPPILASAVWVGGMALYYGSTMFGEPEHNGAPPPRLPAHTAIAGSSPGCHGAPSAGQQGRVLSTPMLAGGQLAVRNSTQARVFLGRQGLLSCQAMWMTVLTCPNSCAYAGHARLCFSPNMCEAGGTPGHHTTVEAFWG